MDEASQAETEPAPGWPSVDDAKPDEEGGPAARIGFNYQDEIAVSFLIEMLEEHSLVRVHCETHDDIVIVRVTPDGSRSAEYVQVKAGEIDKLWSVSDLCFRKGGKIGSSILEKSLARDKHHELSYFRLVTLLPVNDQLKMLTHPCGAEGRAPDGERFKELQVELDTRLPKHSSPKGNNNGFWLENCQWDERHSLEAVKTQNFARVMRLSAKHQTLVLPEHAEQVLEELRAMAKRAGASKWEAGKDKKIFDRSNLVQWWTNRLIQFSEDAAATSGGKLAGKMLEAGLPDDLSKLAIELRRTYAIASRAPKYLDTEEGTKLQSLVKSEVMSLRARLVSGQIDIAPAAFHSLCVERMDDIAEQYKHLGDQSAYLKGCMYDIADRCMLRFVRPE